MPRSYKVVSNETGELEFVIIAPKFWTLAELNNLVRKGMKCTVIDERSHLVDKHYVD